MNILITSHGYVARCLREWFDTHLSTSSLVTLLDLHGNQWRSKDFSKYDAVIHCAALVHKDDKKYSLQDYMDVNAYLTRELGLKARAEGVSYFVFLSTEGVYGTTGSFYGDVVLTKDRVPMPKTKYEISKYEAEKVLRNLENRNFRLAIIRPPFIYGKDCPGNYSRLRDIVLKYGFVPKFENKKSMIYVENLCEFIYQLCKRRKTGVFVPQDLPYRSTAEMCRLIAKCHGRKLIESCIFNSVIKLGSRWIRSLRVSFGSEYYEANESRMDFDYSLVDFEESIRRTEMR